MVKKTKLYMSPAQKKLIEEAPIRIWPGGKGSGMKTIVKDAMKILEKAWKHRNDPPVHAIVVSKEQMEKLKKDPNWTVVKKENEK